MSRKLWLLSLTMTVMLFILCLMFQWTVRQYLCSYMNYVRQEINDLWILALHLVIKPHAFLSSGVPLNEGFLLQKLFFSKKTWPIIFVIHITSDIQKHKCLYLRKTQQVQLMHTTPHHTGKILNIAQWSVICYIITWMDLTLNHGLNDLIVIIQAAH